MIVEQVHVRNFLSHDDTTLDFTTAPLWLICGENGAGKSALFDAIEFALYGCHRGGDKQGSQHLVKHGTRDGVVEVIITISGDRFRIRHHLSPQHGNMRSYLDQADADGGWSPLNPGGSARNVWDWLKPRIPPHDLFRSAIYLRQGETAHFMSGSPAKRIARFAALIDLRRYTDLSERARSRAMTFTTQQAVAKAKLDDLGDISDAALQAAETDVVTANRRFQDAGRAHERARSITAGTTAWEKVLSECASLAAEQARLQLLLTNAEQIRADVASVQRWDRASGMIARYWDHRDRAERLKTAADDAASAAKSTRALATAEATERATVAETRRSVVEDLLPRARTSAKTAWEHARDLKREAEIAAARCCVETATRKVLVLHLHALANARCDAVNASRERGEAQAALQEARRAAEDAENAMRDADAAVKAKEAEVELADNTVNTLTADIARLDGQIRSHSRLSAADRECPVCAQSVSDEVHLHVRQVLSNEEATRSTLKAQLSDAQQRRDEAIRSRTQSESTRDGARTVTQIAATALTRAEERVPQAEERLAAANKHLVDATAALTSMHPQYAKSSSQITHDWITERDAVLMSGFDAGDFEGATITSMQHGLISATATLHTLRSQRRTGADDVGERFSPDVVERDAAAARQEAEASDADVNRLETHGRELDHDLSEADKRITALTEQAAAKLEAANKDWGEVAAEEKRAYKIQTSLGTDWEQVLASKDAYTTTSQEIETLRPNAERAAELDRAAGQLVLITSQLDEAIRVRDATESVYRIPVADAREKEDAAHRSELSALEEKTQADAAVSQLNDRRESAKAYRDVITEAEAQAKTYNDLADLLKEGGPIQVDVAGREQRAIVREVNVVLDLIRDPLRVQLGAPQRAGRIQLQDILVTDMTDPIGSTRFFDYISGGEQFRVALALALALHRRVDGGAVGTLIVDEGFGSLDRDRRDELALQMTDASHGLLQQRLANNIIISTHSSEVQRHFPYRCLVTKEAGTAKVQVFEAEDILVDA